MISGGNAHWHIRRPLVAIGLFWPALPEMAYTGCVVPADQVPAWPWPRRHWPAGGADPADGAGGVFGMVGMA